MFAIKIIYHFLHWFIDSKEKRFILTYVDQFSQFMIAMIMMMIIVFVIIIIITTVLLTELLLPTATVNASPSDCQRWTQYSCILSCLLEDFMIQFLFIADLVESSAVFEEAS